MPCFQQVRACQCSHPPLPSLSFFFYLFIYFLATHTGIEPNSGSYTVCVADSGLWIPGIMSSILGNTPRHPVTPVFSRGDWRKNPKHDVGSMGTHISARGPIDDFLV